MATRGGRVLDAVRRWGTASESSAVVVRGSKERPPPVNSRSPLQQRPKVAAKEHPSWQYEVNGVFWMDFSEEDCKAIDIAWVNNEQVTPLQDHHDEDGKASHVSIVIRQQLGAGAATIERRIGRQVFVVRHVGALPIRRPRKFEDYTSCKFAESQTATASSTTATTQGITLDMLPGAVLAQIFAMAAYSAHCICHIGEFNGFEAARTLCNLELVCTRFGARDSALGGLSATELAALVLCQLVPPPPRKSNDWRGLQAARCCPLTKNWKQTVLWRDHKTEARDRELKWALHRIVYGTRSNALIASKHAEISAAATDLITQRWGGPDQQLVSML